MSVALRWYLRALNKHPWKTQALSTGVIMGTGDIISQTILEHKTLREVESIRIARFAFIGTCFVGPTLRLWYMQLERIFGTSGKLVGVKKMLLDQVGFVPIFLVNFLAISGMLQGHSWKHIRLILKEDYISILQSNYILWPGTQLITFYIIPLQHRVTFVNIIALFWNSYLAWKANRTKDNTTELKEVIC